MKPSQIKTECELIYTQIKNLEERLTRLRSICKHVNTYKDNFLCTDYGMKSICCSDCGKVITPGWEKLGEINGKKI